VPTIAIPIRLPEVLLEDRFVVRQIVMQGLHQLVVILPSQDLRKAAASLSDFVADHKSWRLAHQRSVADVECIPTLSSPPVETCARLQAGSTEFLLIAAYNSKASDADGICS
jgi:hypothetical protein